MNINGLCKWVFNLIVSLCLKYKNNGEDMYYNTTREKEKQLRLNFDKAKNQKQKVSQIPVAHTNNIKSNN